MWQVGRLLGTAWFRVSRELWDKRVGVDFTRALYRKSPRVLSRLHFCLPSRTHFMRWACTRGERYQRSYRGKIRIKAKNDQYIQCYFLIPTAIQVGQCPLIYLLVHHLGVYDNAQLSIAARPTGICNLCHRTLLIDEWDTLMALDYVLVRVLMQGYGCTGCVMYSDFTVPFWVILTALYSRKHEGAMQEQIFIDKGLWKVYHTQRGIMCALFAKSSDRMPYSLSPTVLPLWFCQSESVMHRSFCV